MIRLATLLELGALGAFSVGLGGCVLSDDSAGPSTAQFAVPRGGSLAGDFFAMPFPHDFYREADGTLDLALYPRPSPIIDEYLAAMEPRLDGFGRNAAIFVTFDGPIQTESLPASPEAAQADGASVYLVDVDPDSADRGRRWPLKFRFEAREGESIGANWLSVLPYPGFPLAEGRTYALVVTSRVTGDDGGPVRAGADWTAVSGEVAPDDADLLRARTASEPLLAWLDEAGGDARADVVTAAVFTTQHSTDIMRLLRERVWELPEPVARDVVRTGAFDDYLAYEGVFDAPNFQSGDVPYNTGGEILLADDGLPIVQRTETLRVAYTIPLGPMPVGGWPVAIYAHGTGGSYQSFISDDTAARLAQQGLAVISIDQVLHGPRNPGASPEISFFNFQNPLAARDNTIQGAADDFSVVRLVQGFVLVEAPDGKGDPGRTIRFDDDRIYFFGHSQGGLTGPPFIAFEPAIQGAVLSGAGGLLYLAMLTKTEPVDVAALVAAVIRDQPLDEFNPTLSLLQTWIERADAANYGPLLAREPALLDPADPDGGHFAPRPIFQTEGLVDTFAPPATIEALAVSIGGNLVGPVEQDVPGLALRGAEVLEAPVTGNLDGTTVVLLQYQESPGSDGHFVVFDVAAAEVQSAQFLGTLADTGQATVVEP